MTGRLALETEIEALRAEFVDFDHRSSMLTPEEHARWRAIAERGHALRNQLATREPSGIPRRLREARLYAGDETQAISRARAYVEAEVEHGACLVLSGPTGVGKSWTAAAVLHEVGGAFWFWPSACAGLLRPETRDATLEALRSERLILLDDFGMEYAKEGGLLEALTDEIVWYREAEILPTLITTNLAPDAMRSQWSARIVDRLRGRWASVFAVTGESLRR